MKTAFSKAKAEFDKVKAEHEAQLRHVKLAHTQKVRDPCRLATVTTGGELLAVGQNTVCYNASAERQPAVGFGTGWQQGVMNVALLGLRDLAAEAVYERAATSSGDMRFPACLPNMQNFRPNEDHLSNMRSALQ